MDFIDSEVDVDVSIDEKQYYEDHELKGGGSNWYVDLMEKLNRENYMNNDPFSDIESDDSLNGFTGTFHGLNTKTILIHTYCR